MTLVNSSTAYLATKKTTLSRVLFGVPLSELLNAAIHLCCVPVTPVTAETTNADLVLQTASLFAAAKQSADLPHLVNNCWAMLLICRQNLHLDCHCALPPEQLRWLISVNVNMHSWGESMLMVYAPKPV